MPQLCTSIVIVSSSTYLYNLHPPPPLAKQAAEPLARAETDKEPLSDPRVPDSAAAAAGEGGAQGGAVCELPPWAQESVIVRSNSMVSVDLRDSRE